MRKCFFIFCLFIIVKASAQGSPQRYDVLIHEIMADPAPPVALPNVEWIEMKNTSGRSINLQGWRIASSTATSGAFPSYTLPADSFLIISSTANAPMLAPFGRVLGVPSFPSLNNEGSTLSLISKEGMLIHAIAYTPEWYGNEVKKEGGWSLEMIDAANPCGGSKNWMASSDSRGGTPGTRNSVARANPDDAPPALLRTYAVDSVSVMLLFDETIDSLSAGLSDDYTISGGLAVVSAAPASPLFNTVLVKLSAPMTAGTVYTIRVKNIKDCKGNTISTRNIAKAGLPLTAAKGDIVINEILFDPKTGGEDYIEFYNRGKNVLDASKLYVANRGSAGAVSSVKKLSETPLLIFPQDYIVVTEDSAALRLQYFIKDESAVLPVPALPSMPDDKGTVVLLNEQGMVVDEVSYADDWHFALLADAEGVSLERLDPAAPSQDKTNWHSAASAAGYGTPGYKNSQVAGGGGAGALSVVPKIFSPDNDGLDDFTTISYSLPQNGYVANVTIFDAAGKVVRRLVKNNLLATKGSWNWDGLGESRLRLPMGTYIIYTELFNLQGKKEIFKNVVVLARRLN